MNSPLLNVSTLHTEVNKLYKDFAVYVRSINVLLIINIVTWFSLFAIVDNCDAYKGVGVIALSVCITILILSIMCSMVIYSERHHMSFHSFGHYEYSSVIQKVAIDVYYAYFVQIIRLVLASLMYLIIRFVYRLLTLIIVGQRLLLIYLYLAYHYLYSQH